MRPSWQPDPTGRHDYRWWTGVGWSDQVGDRGVVSIDPGRVPGARPRRERADGRRRSVVVGAGALSLAALAVVVTLRLRSGDDGFGTRTLDLSASGVSERAVTLAAGDAVRFRVEPAPGLDLKVVVVTDEATAGAIASVLASGGDDPDALADRIFTDAVGAVGSDPDATLTGEVAILQVDSAGVDRPEAAWFVARAGGAYRIVVVDDPPRRPGRVRTIVERTAERLAVDIGTDDPALAAAFFVEPAFYESTEPYAG